MANLLLIDLLINWLIAAAHITCKILVINDILTNTDISMQMFCSTDKMLIILFTGGFGWFYSFKMLNARLYFLCLTTAWFKADQPALSYFHLDVPLYWCKLGEKIKFSFFILLTVTWVFTEQTQGLPQVSLYSSSFYVLPFFFFFSPAVNPSSNLNSSITVNVKPQQSHSAQISDTLWVFVCIFLSVSFSLHFLFPPCLHLSRSDLSSISLPVPVVEARELSHYLCIGIIGIHVCAWDRAHPEQGPGPRHDKQGVSKAPRDPLICRRPTGILTYARLIFLYIKQP